MTEHEAQHLLDAIRTPEAKAAMPAAQRRRFGLPLVYALEATPRQRFEAWLKHHGHAVERRGGRDVVLVPRKRHGAMKLFVTETAPGVFRVVGDRKSHRSRPLEQLVAEFNEAESWVSGRLADQYAATLAEQLAGMADHDLQSMVDYYAGDPLGLERVGKGREYSHLTGFALALLRRRAYALEPGRRDRLMSVPVNEAAITPLQPKE